MAIRRAIVDCFAALAMTLALLLAAPAAAQTFPKLTGRVVDQANLLAPEQELDLTSKSEALEAQTGRQFVVATVASLEGRAIEDYGTRLGRHWGIGSEKEDDGVILLVAPNEKKVRIETGYGAEGFLPDILAGRIIRDAILPRFRKGDMAGGIMAGADQVIATMRLPPAEARRRAQEAAARDSGPDKSAILPTIFITIVFFGLIALFSRSTQGQRYRAGRRRRDGVDSGDLAILLWGLDALSQSSRGGGGGGGGWGGGGGFGGFSGGGGSFGGGGSSGSW